MAHSDHRFELVIKGKKGDLVRHPLHSGSQLIGRSQTCDICAPEAAISRKHARLIVTDEKVVVEDLDSLNGTKVEGSVIEGPTPVEVGEEIRFGDLEATLAYPLSGRIDESLEETWLEVLGTNLQGKVFRLDNRRLTVGRSHEADIQLDHPTISRIHAVLRRDPDNRGWLLEDRSSANGTYVDGVMVSEALLEGSETVRFGDIELSLRDYKPTPAPRRYGLLIFLVLLLGASITLLLADLFGLLVE